VKISRFYPVLTIHKYSKHNNKLSVFKQQHIDLQIEHGKAILVIFIEIKDTNMIINNSKQISTK
jgi:hypothetical protein